VRARAGRVRGVGARRAGAGGAALPQDKDRGHVELPAQHWHCGGGELPGGVLGKGRHGGGGGAGCKDEGRDGAGSSSPSAVGSGAGDRGGGSQRQDAEVWPIRGDVGANAVWLVQARNSKRTVQHQNVHKDEVVQGMHESLDAPILEYPQGVHESKKNSRCRTWGGGMERLTNDIWNGL
jgi:hypothetical protein